MKNADMPARPVVMPPNRYVDEQARVMSGEAKPVTYKGLTKCEQFCLTMGVAETGDKELDAIITKGNRQALAAMAMQGQLSCYENHESMSVEAMSRMAVEYADSLLAELEKGEGK